MFTCNVGCTQCWLSAMTVLFNIIFLPSNSLECASIAPSSMQVRPTFVGKAFDAQMVSTLGGQSIPVSLWLIL